MPDTAAAATRLQASLAELEDRLIHIARDLADTPDRDWSEQAIEVEDDESRPNGSLPAPKRRCASTALARLADLRRTRPGNLTSVRDT